jgi:endogenous inhibitor of DNA gyrase (YacG/DUF329 family)
MSGEKAPGNAGAARTVECPACGVRCAFEPWNPWRPFCSERCRTTDLGAWAAESYRVPGKPSGEDPGGENPGPED